jgi:hypothetical protein
MECLERIAMSGIRATSKPSSRRRLARLILVLGVIASATPAYAASPKPDPAPVTPRPQPSTTYTPPPVTTQSPPPTQTSRQAQKPHKTTTHAKRKKQLKAQAAKTKAKTLAVINRPGGADQYSNSSGSTFSDTLKIALVILAGVGFGVSFLVLLGFAYLATR